MSLSERDQALLLFALENLPQIMREVAAVVAEKAASTLPPPNGGRRPVFNAKDSQKVLDYISHLYREGYSMPNAKKRAAKRFGCSRRTVDRLCANCKSVPLEEPPSIQELIRMFIKEGQADGWQAPTH